MMTRNRTHAVSLATSLSRAMASGFVALLLGVSAAVAEVTIEEIRYQAGDAEFVGYLAYDDAVEGKRPGVLVVHEWWGLNDYARKRAEMLAAEGYTALALDMFGGGRTADHPDGAKAFTEEVFADLAQAEGRFDAAKVALQRHETVDPDSIAAIGYCFGGGVVLHMARKGADLDAAVSFHGTLASRTEVEPGAIKARVLVFNGDADPYVPRSQVQEFIAEMQDAEAQYHFVGYPGAIHAFTNPEADNAGERFGMPLGYDAGADRDSWKQTLAFFDILFADGAASR